MDEEFSVDDLTEEELDELIALGVIPDKQAILTDQLKTAQALRDRGSPEMRGSPYSGYQTAANPLEMLAYGLDRRQAKKDIEKYRQDQQGLLGQQVRGRGTYYDALRRKIRDRRKTLGGMTDYGADFEQFADNLDEPTAEY